MKQPLCGLGALGAFAVRSRLSARYGMVVPARFPALPRPLPDHAAYAWPVGAGGLSARVVTAVQAGRRASLAAPSALLAACVLAGCGGSHLTTERVPPPPKTVSAPTVPADNGQDPAILAAYRGSLADFNTVASKAPVQANSPVLANHRSGNHLQHVVAALQNLAQASEVDRGSLTSLDARVTQFNGTQAVVVSCELDMVAIVSAATHQIVTPATGTRELVNDLVQLIGGVWKVTVGSQVHSGCP